MGGAIADAWPLAAIALMGMDENLPRMAEFRDHARALAEAINADGFAHTTPDVPATPLFHVHLPMSRQDAQRAAQNLLEETGIKLFLYARSNPDPRRCAFEVSVGISGLDFTPREVAELIRGLPSRGVSLPEPVQHALVRVSHSVLIDADALVRVRERFDDEQAASLSGYLRSAQSPNTVRAYRVGLDRVGRLVF